MSRREFQLRMGLTPDLSNDEDVAVLLADAKLSKEFEEIRRGINRAEDELLRALRDQSKSKKELRSEIAAAIIPGGGDLSTALKRIQSELRDQKDAPFADIEYDRVFEEKALSFLSQPNARSLVKSYVERYNELLDTSKYFKRGIFDYYNASTIAKTLAVNGFFEAKHTVNLNAEEPKLITNKKDLEAVIAAEKSAILADKELRSAFDALEKLMDKNVALRSFRDYLMDHVELLPKLANAAGFKQELWKSYLKENYGLYRRVIDEYAAASEKEEAIRKEAAKQRTQWEDVIGIFNSRFVVPFTLSVKNMVDVQLGSEPIAALEFTYNDGDDAVPVKKGTLLEALSTGEKKALYILHILFDIEARRKSKRETIMVVDDLADSFDYQNKYAIIQHLKEINDDRLFKQIIMTHNFDFFRTIHGRRLVTYKHCLMVLKDFNGVVLKPAEGIRNVFLNDWKQHFFEDPKKKIASIPFIRNLAEYAGGSLDTVFARLTSLLHWKLDSLDITVGDLDLSYNEVFRTGHVTANGTEPAIDLIREQAEAC